MKIVFEGSELKEGIIKVSLDGGFTFTDYEIADVKESGIPLDDSQCYDKIKIKGPVNILKSLDIVSNVKVEGGQASESSDYNTRIEWYSWKSDDGEIIFTKTDDKTQDCIIYEKRPVDEEGHYDYVEFPSASRIAFSWTDDGIVKSWAGGPGIQTYFYSRYPEGDVVAKEPKSKTPTKIYAWTYYRYETIHTFTRNPKVGDFAFAFNNVEHGFCVDRITEVRTDEDGNVNTIIVRGGIFGYQCEHTIDVGEFSSAHVTQSSFLYDQSEE